jgi:hypothetical protein
MGRARRGFCKHYRAMSEHQTCEAGVPYETFKGMGFDARPCFYTEGKPTPGGCELAVYPTIEEIAARDAEIAKLLEAVATARAAIVEAIGGPWKKGMPPASGTITCPVCQKEEALHFSRAGYNGHIHARCDSGCVAWME